MREVSKVCYTKWKYNRLVESCPIELEEFKEAFLGKCSPRERREVKIDEFINLKKDNMNVEEYSLKFTMFSRYAPFLLSNPGDEMSKFVTTVADLVKEECRTTMLHDDMTLYRLIVYTQSITRYLKRIKPSELIQQRINLADDEDCKTPKK